MATMLATAFLVAGCKTEQPVVRPVEIDEAQAFADRLIAEKIAVAADAQREFVALVNEDKAMMAQKQKSLETDEVDVDYLGKPQELLQVFAHRYGYRFVESGKYRTLRNINVRMTKTPPLEVLRNVGYQINSAANVILDKNAHVLRLEYRDKAIRRRGFRQGPSSQADTPGG